MAKRYGILLNCLMVAWGLLAGGCAWMSEKRESIQPHMYLHAPVESVAQTSEERQRMIRSVVKRDVEALYDDLDMVFMTDRPTRLTKWHDR